MQIPELVHRPGDNRLYDFSFDRFPEFEEGEVVTGASIVQAYPVAPTAPPLTLGGAVFAGSRAQVRAAGGKAGSRYLLRCTVTTSGGNTIVGEGRLAVIDVSS